MGVCNGKSVSGEEGFCAYGMVSLCWVRRAHGRMDGMVSLCRARDLVGVCNGKSVSGEETS